MARDTSEGLCPEDKKFDLLFSPPIAWAIQAASLASFFNRTTTLWLQQLQARVAPRKARLHQDINKIIAATQFSADATLNMAKYASRALDSAVSAHRLLWLRQWSADLKAKWYLAAAPYTGEKLFGELLELLFIETRDKRKILPSSTRLADKRSSPFYRKQSFCAYSQGGPSQQVCP